MQYAELPFKIVVPSRARSKVIGDNPLYDYCHMVVDSDRERRAYEQEGVPPENIVVMPEPPLNISVLRQWILDELWEPDEPFIVQIDDDFLGLRPTMGWRAKSVRNPVDIAAILWESYLSATDAQCGIFGYMADSNPSYRNCNTPIVLRRWVQGGFGILDRELQFDKRLYQSEDVDICLASLVRSRILWKDHRFDLKRKPHRMAGGIQRTRTTQTTQQSDRIVNEKWGSGTVEVTPSPDGGGFRMRVNIG